MTQALAGAEKITLTLSPGQAEGQYQCVFIAMLGTEPAQLSDAAKALRLKLARPFVLRGSAAALDQELDAFLTGQTSERLETQRRLDQLKADEAAARKARASKAASKTAKPAKKPIKKAEPKPTRKARPSAAATQAATSP